MHLKISSAKWRPSGLGLNVLTSNIKTLHTFSGWRVRLINGFMMTSSNQIEAFSALLALCAGNSPVTGEFPTQRPVTRCVGVFFGLRLNQQLSKQWRRRWFEIWGLGVGEWWIGEFHGLSLLCIIYYHTCNKLLITKLSLNLTPVIEVNWGRFGRNLSNFFSLHKEPGGIKTGY